MDPSTFLTALLAIIVIDLVLAGDNAIVIALAARGLPAHLQKRAILWGAVGAIAVRSVMTLVVVWLLNIPGLLLVGGAMLLWIAYKLLLPEDGGGDAHGPVATTFWGAMRTIVVADAVMGLDNVLAVAGASQGSYLLVVLGLLISVPIIVWGSAIVLRVIERVPSVVYLGAGVLVLTGAKMITSEPLLADTFEELTLAKWAVYLTVPLVLWAGFVKNHQRSESRIAARLAELAALRPLGASSAADSRAQPVVPPSTQSAMLKVLVPVDGSENSLRALRHAIDEYQRHHELEIHLLNVQPQLSRHIASFISRHDRDGWHTEKANAALAGARKLLGTAGIAHHVHWSLGDRAVEICRMAASLGAHHIVMGTARRNSLTRMLEDSATDKVLQLTTVPVEVVAGASASKWESWGVPAGVLGAGGLVLLAVG
jgi:YjbE family integral membrane protein